jgi:hypothetical protein
VAKMLASRAGKVEQYMGFDDEQPVVAVFTALLLK